MRCSDPRCVHGGERARHQLTAITYYYWICSVCSIVQMLSRRLLLLLLEAGVSAGVAGTLCAVVAAAQPTARRRGAVLATCPGTVHPGSDWDGMNIHTKEIVAADAAACCEACANTTGCKCPCY